MKAWLWLALCASALAARAQDGSAAVEVLQVPAGAAAPDLRCPQDRGGEPPPLRPAARSEPAADMPMPAPFVAHAATLNPGVPRIGFWGDSHTASGHFVWGLLDAWGLPRDRVQPGFIPPTFGLAGVRSPLRRGCSGGTWQLRVAHKASAGPGHAFTRSLAALASETPDSWIALDFRAPQAGARLKWLDIHFHRDSRERALVLGVRVGDGVERIVSLTASTARRLQVQSDRPIATVTLRLIAGQIAVDGFAPAYEATPVAVVDIFSVPGATAQGWRGAEGEALRQGDDRGPPYDVVLFQYGTNEAMDDSFDGEAYARELRSALSRFRVLNARSRCIVIGPPDRGTPRNAGRGDPQRLAHVHRAIAAIQQKVAVEKACGFWNWQAAMGGPGAAFRWLQRNPPLMQVDLIHLTTQGYETSGGLLGRTIPLRR